MKKIILVLIGIVLISSLIFASRAMSWRGGAGWGTGGWGCGIGQGIGWSYCIPDHTEAQISQRPYGFDPNANLTSGWRKDFSSSQRKGFGRGKRGCGGYRRGCGACWW